MPGLGGLGLDLLAELDDNLVESSRGSVVVDAPNFAENPIAGYRVTAFAVEQSEDGQFARRELETRAVALSAQRGNVNFDLRRIANRREVFRWTVWRAAHV